MLALLLAMLVGLPLLGVLVTGRPLSPYLEFPPLTRFVWHADFSAIAFAGLAGIGLLTFGLLLRHILCGQSEAGAGIEAVRFPFPWWGVIGLALVVVSWILAWTRFSWFAPLQPHTFLPLWLGYILAINGFSFQRTGSCLMTARPLYFGVLFPVSACFWWFFEYLNRFVQNWHYLGIEQFSGSEYVLHATVCFATVLPAVLSTEELLASFPRLSESLKNGVPFTREGGRGLSTILLLASGAGLAGISVWPDYLFPLVWMAPFFIIVFVQQLFGRATILAPLRRGDRRSLWLPPLAALTCGFFWELWNFRSFAHWEYSVPYVQRLHLFEMPLLGYLGYLPFGLECKVVAQLVEDFLPKPGKR